MGQLVDESGIPIGDKWEASNGTMHFEVYVQKTEALLSERQTTHGSFADNAALSQSIKRIFHAAPGWVGLSEVQKEALDMIALKLSRILSGKAGERDHWLDLQGYAGLALKEIEGVR